MTSPARRFAPSPALAGLPPAIDRVVTYFRKLPGVGEKTALRYALWALAHPEEGLALSVELEGLLSTVGTCGACGHLAKAGQRCSICLDTRRQGSQICVVASVQHLMAMEATRAVMGRYHVLGMLVSPLEGMDAGDMKSAIDALRSRLVPGMELLLALPPTTDGGATAMVIARAFKGAGVEITTIAQGLPRNAAMEDADSVTLTRAIEGRKTAPA